MAEPACIFCRIAEGLDPNVELLYQDEEVVVFPDHRPAAPHHYLAIPREHIRDASHLDKSHIPLLEKMVEKGKQVLLEKGATLEDVRMGFHHKPLVLVNHLHLHMLSPVDQLGFVSRLTFRPDSYWFSTVDTLMTAIAKIEPKTTK